MTYNAKRARNRRSLNTSQVKDRMFGDSARKPCHYCGVKLTRDQATFDHKQPLSQGGYDKGKNGVIACKSCNEAKGSMSYEMFMRIARERFGNANVHRRKA